MRHGATDWNSTGRFQGQADVPLNELGRAQAQAVARALQNERFDLAVSSDLSRASETARAIAAGTPLTLDPRWREFSFGEWEGLTWEQIVAGDPALAQHERSAAKIYTPPGGESFEMVRARVREALNDYLEARYRNVLVVTHAGALHAMLHEFFGDREAEMQEVLGVRFTPASMTVIEASGRRASVVSLNAPAHLEHL